MFLKGVLYEGWGILAPLPKTDVLPPPPFPMQLVISIQHQQETSIKSFLITLNLYGTNRYLVLSMHHSYSINALPLSHLKVHCCTPNPASLHELRPTDLDLV